MTMMMKTTGRHSREGETHVAGGVEAFVDDGIVPPELEQDAQDGSGDAAAGDDDFRCCSHVVDAKCYCMFGFGLVS